MTNQEIYELMARFERSGLTTLKITREDCSVEMGKAGVGLAAPVAPAPMVPSTAPEAMDVEEGSFVTAPLVGTFYAAPSPGEAPFVKLEQRVNKGETLCLIEAMKTMNEIKAPCDCVVETVLAQDGDLVSFGQNLIRYREG